MSRRRLLLALLVVGTAGCGQAGPLAGPDPGYSYAPPQQEPHPGIAEGRPVIEIPMRGTWYRCPEIHPDLPTPLISDRCLSTTPDVGVGTLEQYSIVEPSVDCGDGRTATNLGGLGFGFVGQPIIPQRGAAPDREAVLVCLGVLPPS